MRNVLVHADDSPAMAARIESALIIGRRFQSHLTLVISSPFQYYIATDPFGGLYLANEQLAKAQIADAALAKRLDKQMAREDVSWDVLTGDGDALGALALAATLTDLVIVSLCAPGDRRSATPPLMAGDLAVMVPTPVLALPADSKPIDLEAPVMIAWNGSPEAAHALRLAVPLISNSQRVTLVSIGADNGQVPADDALRYLSRYDIHAELRIEERTIETSEEALERVARQLGVGLIVMGAFGHKRLRETFFGGVTRYLLDAAHTPLLLVH